MSLLDIRSHLVACFPEREHAIDNILTALVAREHCLLVGIPGTGKSALAREFAACISGDFYEYLFSKFTTPEEFLGPFSIGGLKQDKYERVLAGRLAECQVAFLDEIFKSNSASLNTLLPILNERIVFQGGGALPIPLRVAVAASNELPSDPSLQALWDRLVLRCFVHPLARDKARRAVMLGEHRPAGKRPTLDLRRLDRFDLTEVELPKAVVDPMMTMRRELEANGIVYGDRRWVKAAKAVRAYTLVTGATKADTTSLKVLSSVLWDKEDQIADVEKTVGKVAAPYVMKAREAIDVLLKEVPADIESRVSDDISKALVKLQDGHKRLQGLAQKADGREREEIKGFATQVAARFNALRAVLRERYGLGTALPEGS